MVEYEAIFAIREDVPICSVAGREEMPCPSYRIRRDKLDAADESSAREGARKIKQNIADCFTSVRLLSLSDKLGLPVPKYDPF